MTDARHRDPTVVRFWGTRGVVPVSATARDVRDKIANALVVARGAPIATYEEALRFIDGELDFAAAATYGGATSCVEIESGDDAFFLCDMGSGLQQFGRDAMRLCRRGRTGKFNIFLSHMHSDHIMGFPSFAPACDDGSKIVIHACHSDAEDALRQQQEEAFSSVPFDSLAANISFVTLEPGREIEVDGLRVTAMRQDHPGGSFGYRFVDSAGRSRITSESSCQVEKIRSMVRRTSYAAATAFSTPGPDTPSPRTWMLTGIPMTSSTQARRGSSRAGAVTGALTGAPGRSRTAASRCSPGR